MSLAMPQRVSRVAVPFIARALSMSLLVTTSVFASETSDPCSHVEAELKAKTAAIAARFKGQMEGKKAEYQEDAENIKRDADENQPTTFGGITNVDVHVDWKDTSIIFDLPVVALNQTTLIMGIPEVTLNQQNWVYDLPAVRMKEEKVFQHPEITCSPFPNCSVTYKDNIISVPEPYMERHEVILGVPEFAIREQQIIFGVPAVAMQRQEVVMGLPQITLKNVSAAVGTVKDEALALQQKVGSDTNRLTEGMRAEIRQTTSTTLAAVFACQKSRLAANRTNALAQIDGQLLKATSSAQTARVNHAEASAAAADSVVQQIVAARASVNVQFDDAERTLTASEQKALKSL